MISFSVSCVKPGFFTEGCLFFPAPYDILSKNAVVQVKGGIFVLFSPCGRHLKLLAIILQWLSLIAGPLLSILGLIMCFSRYSDAAQAGIVLVIWGASLLVGGYVLSQCLYGFGIIVNDCEFKLYTSRATPAPADSTSLPGKPATTTADMPKMDASTADTPKMDTAPSAAPSPQPPAPVKKVRAQSVKLPQAESRLAPGEHIAYALRFTTDDGMISYLRDCQFNEPASTEITACLDSANPRAALAEWLKTHQ